jgi:hypothetical protein
MKTTFPIHHLKISWSTSKGRETYGYNICRLDDSLTGKRYKTCGGGYDMNGTVFADWLQDCFQSELMALKDRAYYVDDGHSLSTPARPASFYGMYDNTRSKKGNITLDGGCGLESIIKIAKAIGLEIQRECIQTGKRRGETIGWYVQMAESV